MIKTGKIKGLVVDMSGCPIVEAAVLIDENSPTKKDYIALTNKEGEYSIDDLNPGIYTIIVNAPGRVVVSRMIDVDGGNEAILDFLLAY